MPIRTLAALTLLLSCLSGCGGSGETQVPPALPRPLRKGDGTSSGIVKAAPGKELAVFANPCIYDSSAVENQRRLREEYGVSTLFTWYENLDDALDAGWPCSRIALLLSACSHKSPEEVEARLKTARERCGEPFRFVYLDEPDGPRSWWDRTFGEPPRNGCGEEQVRRFRDIAHRYGSRFVVGHFEDFGRWAAFADEIVYTQYHQAFTGDQSGVWEDLRDDFGTKGSWISASDISRGWVADVWADMTLQSEETEEYEQAFTAADRLGFDHLFIYAWELRSCEDFWRMMDIIAGYAFASGWLRLEFDFVDP